MIYLQKIVKVLFFFLPFFIWLLIYFQGETYIIIYKGKNWENSLILPTSRLWQVVLILTFFQLANLLFYFLLKKDFFVKINYIYILFHFFLALKIYFFNFY